MKKFSKHLCFTLILATVAIFSGMGKDARLHKHGKSNESSFLENRKLTVFDPQVISESSISNMAGYAPSGTAATTIIVTDVLEGGVFNYSASAPTGFLVDGAIVVASTSTLGGYWVRQIDRTYVLPEWFGAVGNGTTDDAAAINSAIQSANYDKIGQVTLRNVSYAISTTINMYKGVSLTGSLQGPTTNPTQTRTIIVALAALTGKDAIKFDFTPTSTTNWPIDVTLQNLNINMAAVSDTTAGSGVHLTVPHTGNVLNGIQITNVSVYHSPQYGFWNELNVNGVKFTKCYAEYTTKNGFEMDGRDTYLDFCAGASAGDTTKPANGLFVTGNSLRVTNCDFYKNSGNGIVDEGFVNYYDNVVSNGNGTNGVFLTGTSSGGQNNIKFINCRIFNNSGNANNTYSDLYIGTAGSPLRGISTEIINSEFSYSGGTVQYSINMPVQPTQMTLTGNSFFTAGLYNTSGSSVSSAVSQYAYIDNCTRGGTFLGNTPIVVSGSTINVQQGTIFETNNTSATTISSFTNGQPGQKMILFINDAFTSINFGPGSMLKNGSNNSSLAVSQGNSLTCICENSTSWFCILN